MSNHVKFCWWNSSLSIMTSRMKESKNEHIRIWYVRRAWFQTLKSQNYVCWSHLNADGIHWIYMLFRRQRRQFCRALRLLLFFATQDDLGWLLTWIWVTNDLKLDSCGTLMIVIVSLHVSTSLNKAQDGPRFTNNWPILTKCDCVSVSVCVWVCACVCVCLPKASSVQRLQSSFLCRPLFSNSQIEISVGVQTVQGSCKSHASSSPSDQPDSANAVSHNWWYYTYWYVDV